MSRKKLLAGNWKMHKTNAELSAFFESFIAESKGSLSSIDILFALPFTLLQRAKELTQDQNITIAAQNIHHEQSGAFTGEVSIPMLRDIGVTATLIGHSERRQYFGETDESVAKKMLACLAGSITPVVCVGELKEEREQGKTNEVLTRQVEAFLSATRDLKDLIIAYEPVWAIGTGLTATSDQAQEAHAFIRGLVRKHHGELKAESIRILYGGSAKPDNIAELVSKPDVDGGLVGGASLKPSDFAAMAIICAGD